MTEHHAESGARRARLATQAELDVLCRTGTELVHEAIDSGDTAIAEACARRVVEARVGLVGLMNEWVGSSISYVRDTYGEAAVVPILDADLWLEVGLRLGISLDEAVLAKEIFAGSSAAVDRLAALAGGGDLGDAKRLWDEIDQAMLKLHDFRIDWLTAVISHIYKRHGADGLYGAMLRAAEADWWRSRMEADLARVDDPLGRATDWAFFLGVGNWGTVSMTEHDDRFVIHHQVCGSCGRQELRSVHEPPLSFARVTEEIPGLNFGNPRYTVYRTHLAVWHFVLPIREKGHPWPAIDCSGVPGRCWFTLYKDPLATPEPYYERAGLVKPG